MKKPYFSLIADGARCLRWHSVSPPEKNVCPDCGKSEVVCSGCGALRFLRPSCDRRLIRLESDSFKEKGGVFLVAKSDFAEKGFILDGHRWDGSDFIHSRDGFSMFLTNRARSVLEKCGIVATEFSKVRLATDGMSDQEKEWLSEVS